jgi:hypothetical protein
MKSATRLGSGVRAIGVGFLMVGAVLVAPTAAFAAGTGYTPGGAPNGGAATGLPGNVVATTTIQPSGGTASATIGGTTVLATVPAGAFTGPVQLVVTDASTSSVTPPGGAASVVTFGIGFFVNGTKVTVTAGSTVYFVTGSTLQSVSGAAVKDGSATITITSDPVAEVATPVAAAATATGSGSPIVGATSTQTGQPFFLESLAAAGLIAFGSLLLVGLRLRRRTA